MAEFTWDDVHTDNEVVKDTGLDDDEIENRSFDDEDSLEQNGGKKGDDDDDTTNAGGDGSDVNKNDDKGANAGNGTDNESQTGTEDMSGIELYLSQFDIVGGMIQYEDGTEKHFDDLTPAEQADVLRELHGSTASSIEEKYGLDKDEIGLINHLRENNISVEQFIEQEVSEKVNQAILAQGSASIDYTQLTDDAVYTKFLQESSPDATPEQLAADLTKAKEMTNYTKLVESLRSQYTATQTAATQKIADEQAVEHTALIEGQRQEIVNAVVPMTEFAGVQLTDTIKNEVLDRILQVDEDGDSSFMSEVFSDPESLFKAAFWFTYGESLMQQRDDFWKKEKSAAYKRGKEDALGSSSAGTRKSFTSAQTATQVQKPDPHKRRTQVDIDEDDWTTLNT